MMLTVILVLFSTMSVDGQCDISQGLTGTYTDTANNSVVKHIQSDNYPNYYSNYIDCTSTIVNTGSGQILFYVEDADLELSYDFLKIYSGSEFGPILYDSYYNSAPFVGLTTAGDDLIATFTSDYSITYPGYKMSFLDLQNQVSCGSSVTASSSNQILSYVDASSQPDSCTWTINPADVSSSINIDVLLVDGYARIREDGQDSNFLYTAGYSYVSEQVGTSVQVFGVSGNNFVVQYSSSATAGTGVVSPAPVTSSDATSICSSPFRSSYNYQQFLNSPGYPSHYSDYLSCSVVLEADDISQSVSVTLIDYTVEIYDSLSIYDGNDFYYNAFSGVSTGAVFTSSGASLSLFFLTNDFGQNRGFNLSFHSVTREIPTCDFQHDEVVPSSADEHTIESPNYPTGYYDYSDTYWLIVKPVESDIIVLDFRVFEVEENADCSYDYVAIYDGACTSDPLLAKICGYDPVTFEEPTGLYILVHFHTDSTITKKGFALTHYIGQYIDPDADEDDEGVGVKDFIYPIIAIVVILIIAGVIFTVIYCKSRGRVGAGEVKPAPKRRTTHDLMNELSNRYNSAEMDKYPKAKRKVQMYHPEPNAPGPNVNIINRGQYPPHPPPVLSDPAYPPDFMSTGSQMPVQNIAPVFAPGSSTAPTAPPLPNVSAPSMIPQPYHYLTPAQARAQGIYH